MEQIKKPAEAVESSSKMFEDALMAFNFSKPSKQKEKAKVQSSIFSKLVSGNLEDEASQASTVANS